MSFPTAVSKHKLPVVGKDVNGLKESELVIWVFQLSISLHAVAHVYTGWWANTHIWVLYVLHKAHRVIASSVLLIIVF